jgi:hypothetical protein
MAYFHCPGSKCMAQCVKIGICLTSSFQKAFKNILHGVRFHRPTNFIADYKTPLVIVAII